MIFDTHAHYDDEKFDEDREKIIEEIYKSGVTKFISAGYSLESSKKGLEFAHKYDFVYTTSGISPNDILNSLEENELELNKLEELVSKELKKEFPKILGIGEIGLDYYWNKENKDLQKQVFIKQIDLANKYNLPIIIHTRDAISDTLEILKKHPVNRKGVFHCCPLNRELVKEALKLGFIISFCGPVTFKNSKNADEIIEMVPLEKMFIETDSPYLSPEPLRGKRNDSRNVKYIAQRIANVKKMNVEEIAKITYQNAEKFYKIS